MKFTEAEIDEYLAVLKKLLTQADRIEIRAQRGLKTRDALPGEDPRWAYHFLTGAQRIDFHLTIDPQKGGEGFEISELIDKEKTGKVDGQ
jgi:hypothetical protein